MTKHNLHGLGTALITPFLPSGAVDYTALDKLLDKQLTGRVDYIVVLGTTGEAATLDDTEKAQVRQFIVRKIAGRLPLVLGLGGNNTHRVIEEVTALRHTDHCPWAAILSVCPYYNKPSQEGLFRHFSAIAEASPVPVILYNVPGRTGVNLLPETVMRLHKACPNAIIGIKEASGNVEQIKRLIALTQTEEQERRLMVISGDDGIAAELMQAGADGLISVAANAFPEDFSKIVHNADSALQARYAKMIGLLFKEGNPSGIKTVLSEMGLVKNYLRLPLVPNSKEVQEEINIELCTLLSSL